MVASIGHRMLTILSLATCLVSLGCQDDSGELTGVRKKRVETDTRVKIKGRWLHIEEDDSAEGGKRAWMWVIHSYGLLERKGTFERFKLTKMPEEDQDPESFEWDEKYSGTWVVDGYTLFFEPTEYLTPTGVYMDMSDLPVSEARSRFQKPWKALSKIERDVKKTPNEGTMTLTMDDDVELVFSKLKEPEKKEDDKSKTE